MTWASARLGRLGPWLLVAVAVVAVALGTGRSGGEGDPLDPRSTGPLGARALVLVLQEMGATVQLTSGAPDPGAGTAVLLSDDLGEGGREAVREWVVAGGTLVVADPRSPLAPPVDSGGAGGPFGAGLDRRLRPECALRAVSEVGTIQPGGGVALAPPAGAVGCFPGGDGFFLVAREEGRGHVVALGGAALFLNSGIGRADNAVLAVSLLAPRPGARVAFLERPPPGSGDRGLTELVPPRVRNALWQLLGAFAVFALWRGRRLGRPVLEPQPVEVAGSELVVAVGNLLQQARRRDAAADMLRAELRRVLADRLGLPPGSPAEAFVAAASQRGSPSPGAVAAALERRPLSSDAELVDLARSMEDIRREASHARQ